ncbi:MAG: TonB-dependent receptor plug domain-containing protein [Gemmatimonadetes bacterium]|nr:TonB-dependent receptor plug domain-containing protein [Gemmatimonadota bacterium]
MSDEARRSRGLGRAQRRLTATELAPVERSGEHLANALARLMPGIQVRSGRSQPGEILCIEFRNPATLVGGGCRAPLVIVDNVRQANGLVTLNTLPIANIHSIEALSPGDAGVRYGAGSGNGVIVIETVSAALDRPRAGPVRARIYDWSPETEPYPWARNLGTAVATNAAGLLAGYALSSSCLSYETLSLHFTEARCGFAANTGARLAIYAAPQLGVGYLTGRVGTTELSRGSMWRNAAAGAILSAPGIVLALTDGDDGFTGSTEIGIFMAVVGAPVASVLADRWFRGTRR